MEKVLLSGYGPVSGLYKKKPRAKDVYWNSELGLYLSGPQGAQKVGSKASGRGYLVKQVEGEWVTAKGEKVTIQVEEATAQEPVAVAVSSRFDNIKGGYLKSEMTAGGRPIYRNVEDGKDLWFDGEHWMIGETNRRSFYVQSKPTKQDPDDAEFDGDVRVWRVQPSKITGTNWQGTSDQYRDPDFPKEEQHEQDFCWVRGSLLQNEPLLFNCVEPNDIAQGALGDCWLLAAAAAIAEFPSFVTTTLFQTQEIQQNGKYELSLYDPRLKRVVTVTVDDLIPCSLPKWWEGTKPRPLYAQPHGNELWMLLLERAFAKLAGGYSYLSGGFPLLAWLCMTGCEDLAVWQKHENSWTESQIDLGPLRGDKISFQNLSTKGSSSSRTSDLFDVIRQYDAQNYLMAASISGDVMEKKRSDGLIERHAYTLIGAATYNGVVNLVKLRNPWADTHEYNGPWSDSSSEWTPAARAQLKYDPDVADGLFWMPFPAFQATFDMLQVAKTNMRRGGDPSKQQPSGSDDDNNKASSSSWSFSSLLPHFESPPSPENAMPPIAAPGDDLVTVRAERDTALAKVAVLEAKLNNLEAVCPPLPAPSFDEDRYNQVMDTAREVYATVMK